MDTLGHAGLLHFAHGNRTGADGSAAPIGAARQGAVDPGMV